MPVSPEFTAPIRGPEPHPPTCGSVGQVVLSDKKVSKAAPGVLAQPTEQKAEAILVDISQLQPAPHLQAKPEPLREKSLAEVGSWSEKATKETIEALVQGFESGGTPYPSLLQTFLLIPCQALQNLKKVNLELHSKMVHAVLTMIRTGDRAEILAVFDKDRNLVQALAELTPDVNWAPENTNPPLCWAVWRNISKLDKLLRILVGLGADVNKKGKRGETPIYKAIRAGRTETVKLLVSLGADVNIPAANGTTPTLEALLHQKCDMIQTLLSLHASYVLADLNRPENNRTPLYNAVASGDEEKVKFLISMGANVSQPAGADVKPPLWRALFKGSLSIIKLLIDHGTKLNPEDVNCSSGGQTPLYNAVASGDEEKVKFLISMGANVNQPAGADVKPPLWRALFTGSLSMIKFLIDHGAQVKPEEVNYPFGDTPLIWALFNISPHERLEWVKFLTSVGADCNLLDEAGYTPLSHVDALPSSEAKPISQWLIDHGADKKWHESFTCLKGMAHNWALKGEGKIYNVKTRTFQTIKLTGWPHLCSLKLMRLLFQDFVEEQMKPMGSEYQTLGERTLKILDRSVDYGRSAELCKELVRVSENEPVFLSGGISEHSIGFVVYQNRICLCNRGQGAGKSPGIKEYAFNRKLETQLLLFIQKALRGKDSWLVLKATFDDLQPLLKRMFHQNKQEVGNCSWTSNESGLHALLRIIMETQTPRIKYSILDWLDINSAFSLFSRKKTLLAYLQVPNPDPSVLQQIEGKLRKEDEDLPFSSEEKEELLKKIVEKIHSSSIS